MGIIWHLYERATGLYGISFDQSSYAKESGSSLRSDGARVLMLLRDSEALSFQCSCSRPASAAGMALLPWRQAAGSLR